MERNIVKGAKRLVYILCSVCLLEASVIFRVCDVRIVLVKVKEWSAKLNKKWLLGLSGVQCSAFTGLLGLYQKAKE